MAARKTSRKRSAGWEKVDASMRIILLHGPDRFLQGMYVEQLTESLNTAGLDPDVLRFDGRSAELSEILDECRTFGLMAQHKLVIIDDADQLVRAEDRRAALERYAESPAENASLVLKAPGWKYPKLKKLCAKHGAEIHCEMTEPAQLQRWVIGFAAKRHEVTIEQRGARLLVERVGCDLGRLAGTIARLGAMVDRGDTVHHEMIEAEVGVSRQEKAWEVQHAILTGEPEAALAKLRELIDVSDVPPTLVRYFIADLVRKLHLLASAAESPGGARVNPWPIPPATAQSLHRRLGRDGLAALLNEAVTCDARVKSGRADDERSLEVLALRFASALAS